jgi:hypothetical protein
MGRARSMPDEQLLKSWFQAGVSYKQMVELWFEISGERASHPAMLGKCQRYDWYEPRQMKHAGGLLTPWTNIRDEHTYLHDIQMLRKESARRAGHKFNETQNKRIDGYLKGLKEDDCVVMYRRDTIEGFFHVKRRKGDEEYTRLPADYKRLEDAS